MYGADPMLAGRGPRPSGVGPGHRRAPLLAGLWAAVCLTGVALVFWLEDWRYALPTALPSDHRERRPGEVLERPESLARLLGPSGARPTLLHFYNPDCPCSRFNLEHLRELVDRFGERVDFALVVELDPERQRFEPPADLELPFAIDRDGELADQYGVYATPIAVVLDHDDRLAHLGNYTSARYCVDPAREYVRLALEVLLDDRPASELAAAPVPFGCSLPSDRTRRSADPRP